jgi:hypothetical protein
MDEKQSVFDRRFHLHGVKQELTEEEWQNGILPGLVPLPPIKLKDGQETPKGPWPAVVFCVAILLVVVALVVWEVRSRRLGPGR